MQRGSATPVLSRSRGMRKSLIYEDFEDETALNCTKGTSTPYNARFAKPPRSTYDAHRPLRADENLDTILTWRVQRKVSDALTLLNDRVIWLLDDTPATRRLIGRYIDVWEYPDGRLEIRADGVVLPCVPYDKLAEIDQGAVIEHNFLTVWWLVAERGKPTRRYPLLSPSSSSV